MTSGTAPRTYKQNTDTHCIGCSSTVEKCYWRHDLRTDYDYTTIFDELLCVCVFGELCLNLAREFYFYISVDGCCRRCGYLLIPKIKIIKLIS